MEPELSLTLRNNSMIKKCIMLYITVVYINLTSVGQTKELVNCNFNGEVKCEWVYQTGWVQNYNGLLDLTKHWNACVKPLNNNSTPDILEKSCAGSDRIFALNGAVVRFPENTTENNAFGHMIIDHSSNWSEGFIFELADTLSNAYFGTYYRLEMKIAYSDTTKSSGNTVNYPSGNPFYTVKDKKHKFRVAFSENMENWDRGYNNEFWDDITDRFVIEENSASEWKTVVYEFAVPRNIDASKLKYLVIRADVHPDVAAVNQHFYDDLFIDDVKLTRHNACESMCIADNGRENIKVKCLVPTSSTSFDTINVDNETQLLNFGTNYRSDFKLIITNAMYYSVEIYDEWGGKQYHYESKDLNLLEDDYTNIGGFLPDTTVFRWWGTSQDGTPLMNAGNITQYLILINYRNCSTNKYISTSILFNHLNQTFNYTDIRPENFVDTLANCCPEILEVDNFTYTTSVRESRNNYIYAALNDPVTVSSGTFVQYNAGNEIKLGSGFTVASGGKFEANIRGCVQNHYNQWKRSPVSSGTFVSDFRENLFEAETSQQEKYLLYPNPAKAEVIVLAANNDVQYNILDLVGRVIDAGTINAGTNTIDISAFRKGTYTVIIDQTYVKKIIKY